MRFSFKLAAILEILVISNVYIPSFQRLPTRGAKTSDIEALLPTGEPLGLVFEAESVFEVEIVPACRELHPEVFVDVMDAMHGQMLHETVEPFF